MVHSGKGCHPGYPLTGLLLARQQLLGISVQGLLAGARRPKRSFFLLLFLLTGRSKSLIFPHGALPNTFHSFQATARSGASRDDLEGIVRVTLSVLGSFFT
jgi:hypothetical protein